MAPAPASVSQPVAQLGPPPRDLRLDIVRGWMQISIFVPHVAGTGLAWGIHAAWGVSDSSEQFVFLSGLVLGSVFALKAARDGEGVARADLMRRTLQLYRTHLAALAIFAMLVLAAQTSLPVPGEVDRLGWTGLHVAGRALRRSRCFRPLLAWGAVQAGWVATPGFGETGIAFDPLAWQLLFLLGAWLGRRALLRGEAVPRHRALIAMALAVVVAGFWARLVTHGFVPGPEAAGLALMGKEILPPARLIHALALAYLVAVLVPKGHRW